jgi:small-conductance mechanosensitive channel
VSASAGPPSEEDAPRGDPTAPDPARVQPESIEPAQIRQQPAVREALKETTPSARSEKDHRPRSRAWAWGLAAAIFAGVYLLLDRGALASSLGRNDVLERWVLAALATTGLLAVHSIVAAIVLPRLRERAARYNLRRVLNLATALLIAFSVISVLFVGWYGAAVSFGLISLILGFALQAPLTSFFAWIYILVRSPYRVGDRIRIGQATGDVIDVAYLDTTLWEFGGEFLSTDHPSGRIIRFPNSTVFNSTVFNYSWPLFPYIWNEITVQVAYESDLEFVASVMMTTVEEEMGPAMEERVRVYREILADTPVDHLEVADRPAVLFRVNPNTWIDATVRYLVTPRRAGTRKTLLTRRILDRLNSEPDKVLFPKANTR